jgi:hypothetical protein
MPRNFPEPDDLRRQIEGGYIRTDQPIDYEPDSYEFFAFMYFLNWREGKLTKDLRLPSFWWHVKTLVRGAIEHAKNRP